jgi:phosphoribosylformylglycinamidine cyclo-ligase
MAHVTGGGLAANLERVLPEELRATVDRATWTPAPIFDVVRRVGSVSQPELESTLNCGVGMVAVVSPDDADRAVSLLAGHGVTAWVCGEVSLADDHGRVPGGSVSLVGQFGSW